MIAWAGSAKRRSMPLRNSSTFRQLRCTALPRFTTCSRSPSARVGRSECASIWPAALPTRISSKTCPTEAWPPRASALVNGPLPPWSSTREYWPPRPSLRQFGDRNSNSSSKVLIPAPKLHPTLRCRRPTKQPSCYDVLAVPTRSTSPRSSAVAASVPCRRRAQWAPKPSSPLWLNPTSLGAVAPPSPRGANGRQFARNPHTRTISSATRMSLNPAPSKTAR